MLTDLRYGLRHWRKSPGFVAVALLTLALGIGANVAIFSLVNAVLLQQLPVKNGSQLAILTDPNSSGKNFGTTGGTRGQLAYPEYKAIRDQNTVFAGVLAADSQTEDSQVSWAAANPAASSAGGAEKVETKLVSANYFRVLGVEAWRGRTFAANEGQNIGADPVAVMSHAYWTQRFNRDPGVIGRHFRLYGHVFTVVGVAPPGFFGETIGQAPELFIPLTMAQQVLPGGLDLLENPPNSVSRAMWLQVIGRRKPGVTLAAAQAATNAIFRQLVQQQAGATTDAQQRHEILNQKLKLSSGASGASPLRGDFTDPLLALFALVGLVLLLAIVNLASLLLARAAARRKEIAVRLALGASRSRIARQLVTESVLLSVVGGLIGAGLAVWGDGVLLRMVSNGPMPIPLSLHADWRVFGFVAGLCVLTGVLFGLAPALHMARLDLNSTLQSQGRGGTRHGRIARGWLVRGGLPLGKVLIIGQVAISVVLLVGAALFIRSLRQLDQVALGFNADHLIEFGIDAGAAGYKDAAAAAYFHRLQEAMAAVPGVLSVAHSMDGLFAGSEGGLPVAIYGYKGPDGKNAAGIRFDEVSAGYFQTTGIPILLGRSLNAADESGVKHAVINQTAAEKFFPNRNPIGQQIHDLYPDDKNAVYTVVGVARDARYRNLTDKTPPRMYLSFFNGIPDLQISQSNTLVRAAGRVGTVEAGLREAIHSTDASVPMPEFATVPSLVGRSLVSQTLLARLSGFFGVLALLLAAIGLYGVMAYGVARRGPEIGIRMALGADRSRVLRMILWETAVVALIGVTVGIPASLGGAKIVASQIHLYGLSYYDPASLAAAVGVLLAVALLAGFLPARRASRVHPMTALREE